METSAIVDARSLPLQPVSPKLGESDAENCRPRVLVVLEHYVPGYRAGGPPRTVANLVARLGDRLDFWIFTRNHDFADRIPYPTVRSDNWNEVGKARVFYCSPRNLWKGAIRRVVDEVGPQVVYLNSFFSPLT